MAVSAKTGSRCNSVRWALILFLFGLLLATGPGCGESTAIQPAPGQEYKGESASSEDMHSAANERGDGSGTEEEVRLPVYPGAVRLAESDDMDPFSIDACYFTSDGFGKAYACYCEKLSPTALVTDREAYWAFL